MANEQHLEILQKGVDAWNNWRNANPEIQPDLSESDLGELDLGGVNLVAADLHRINLGGANLMAADISRANLVGANLSGAYLSQSNFFEADISQANLSEAYLFEANLSRVNLTGADLRWVYLGQADLSGAHLSGANLSEVDLRGASLVGTNLEWSDLRSANLTGADLQATNLRGANLTNANLMGARLLKTNFEDANLTGCVIYGVACWGLKLTGAIQSNLVITPPDEPAIATDNIEIGQFIYLLLNHSKLREVINNNSSQLVLIIGQFKQQEQKVVLNAIQDELRQQNYVPIVFDFEKAVSKDIAETISTLAQMAKFLIVDFTEIKSIPQALQRIIPKLSSVPVQPLIRDSAKNDFLLELGQQYSWVLPIYQYQSIEEAIASVKAKIISPAVKKADELKG